MPTELESDPTLLRRRVDAAIDPVLAEGEAAVFVVLRLEPPSTWMVVGVGSRSRGGAAITDRKIVAAALKGGVAMLEDPGTSGGRVSPVVGFVPPEGAPS